MGQANELVRIANAAAVAAFAPSEAKFPFLKEVIAVPDDIKWWDAVLTIAAVYIAATRLRNLELGDSRETKLMARVSERLVEFNANALAAFEDCKEFFGTNFDALTAQGHDPRFIASDSIGLWIAWNLLDRRPNSQDEWDFVRGIGAMITHSFFSWWDQKI